MKAVALPLVAAGAALAIASAAHPQSGPDRNLDLVAQARGYAFQLREGHYELAPEAVALLEPAVRATPDDPRLWNALTSAYFQQAAAERQPGGDPVQAMKALTNGAAAAARALELAPADPEALAAHGASLAIQSGLQGKPELLPQGVAEMNRAVEVAATAAVPRLQRAFTVLNLPPKFRDAQAIEADLQFLLRLSDGRRPGDVVHLLLGDLYAETGRPELARAQYQLAARPGSTMIAKASQRLSTIDQTGVPAAEITRLRAEIGRDCAMCHAR